MLAVEYYFAFHPRPTIQQVRAGASVFSMLGHVEAFGYTEDNTWWFFDPGRKVTTLNVLHRHDDVEAMMEEKFAKSLWVLRTSHTRELKIPFHLPMTCATQCAGLIGMRAFTPWGFRQKLLANNAKVIHGPVDSAGRPRRKEGSGTGAPEIDLGTAPGGRAERSISDD